uniref:Solute carrier family 6 member 16 n=2 Tax=Pipistrellus kuhlii TaxID=59472 RepID=A0A7J7RCG6_PIPKU|nr:solute carrier family 6 member 16 [Pipistrellus kuhlii]
MALFEKEESESGYTRPLWPSKDTFILSLLGFSLRALNFWRFPYLWLHNGGWSFFLIYLVLLFVVGIPLLFLEMAVGQRMRQNSVFSWAVISPWFSGVGFSSLMVSFITAMYLNVVNAWILFYLGQSFHFSTLWRQCPLLKNASSFDPECARTAPSMYFWYRMTLRASDRIEDRGPPAVTLLLPLLIAWCLVGIFMINGIRGIARVEYVLIPLTTINIILFFVRSLLLTGAQNGLRYLTFMKVSCMYSLRSWVQAGVQVLFALGLGYGPAVVYSSYVDQPSNCLNDAFILAFVNLGFSVLSSPFIFSVLGFWATIITQNCAAKNSELLLKLVLEGKLPTEAFPPSNMQTLPATVFNSWLNKLSKRTKNMVLKYVTECDLEKQFMKVKEGPNFAFLAFIEAISFVPGSAFWSILFFLLLLSLEMNCMIGLLQSVLTPLQDTFAFCRNHAKLFRVFLFGLMFLCGTFFIKPAGVYYIVLLADYWMVLPIIFIIIFENVAVSWAYGSRRFLAELGTLWNHPIHPIFHWLWCCVCPAVLTGLFAAILSFQNMKNFTYVAWDSSTSQQVYRPYPSWVLFLMISVFLVITLPIPLYSVYSYTHGTPFKPRSLDGSLTSSRPKSEDQPTEAPQASSEPAGPSVV